MGRILSGTVHVRVLWGIEYSTPDREKSQARGDRLVFLKGELLPGRPWIQAPTVRSNSEGPLPPRVTVLPLARVILQPARQLLQMLLMVVIGSDEDEGQGIAVQPGAPIRIQKISLGNRRAQVE
jgi:hypothetical protein